MSVKRGIELCIFTKGIKFLNPCKENYACANAY